MTQFDRSPQGASGAESRLLRRDRDALANVDVLLAVRLDRDRFAPRVGGAAVDDSGEGAAGGGWAVGAGFATVVVRNVVLVGGLRFL